MTSPAPPEEDPCAAGHQTGSERQPIWSAALDRGGQIVGVARITYCYNCPFVQTENRPLEEGENWWG